MQLFTKGNAMKITAVIKGDRVMQPLHIKEKHNSFWSTFEAKENGVIVTLNEPTEQLAGGVFISEARLNELEIILEVLQRKRNEAKESIEDESRR